MEDIIKLNSNGGVNNYLKKLKRTDGSESKTYVLKLEYPNPRAGYSESRYKYVSPFGGPTIIEGSLLKEADAVVETIMYISGLGHVIIFE